jgi:O-antigen ligase
MTVSPFVAGIAESLPSTERARPAFAAAWVVAFSIPWDDMVLLPKQVQLARVLSLVAALIWAVSVLRGGTVRQPAVAHGWMGAFLVWTSLGIFWSIYPENTVRRSLSFLQLFTITWVIYQFSANRRRHLRLLQAFIWGEYVLLGGVLFSCLSSRALGDGRYSAPGVNANDAAGAIALGVPIACYLFSLRARGWSWLNALYLPLATVCILLTGTRGGLLTLGVAAIFPLLLLSLLQWRWKLAFAVVVVSSIAAAWSFAGTPVWRRLSTIPEQFRARDLNGRVDVWTTGLALFEGHPWRGIGGGTFAATTGSRQTLSISGHNSFVEVLVESGGIGLALFLFIIISVARKRPRTTRMEAAMWMVLLAEWLVTNLSCSWGNKNVTWLLWGLMLGYPLPFRAPAVFRFQRMPPRDVTTLQPAEAGRDHGGTRA